MVDEAQDDKTQLEIVGTGQRTIGSHEDALALRAQAQKNTDAEHAMSLRDAVRLYPKSILYCIVISMAIIMEGYQVALVPSLFAQPAFQRKYGQAQECIACVFNSVLTNKPPRTA